MSYLEGNSEFGDSFIFRYEDIEKSRRTYYELNDKLKIETISVHSENGNSKITSITPADQKLVDEGIEKLVISVIEDRVSAPPSWSISSGFMT